MTAPPQSRFLDATFWIATSFSPFRRQVALGWPAAVHLSLPSLPKERTRIRRKSEGRFSKYDATVRKLILPDFPRLVLRYLLAISPLSLASGYFLNNETYNLQSFPVYQFLSIGILFCWFYLDSLFISYSHLSCSIFVGFTLFYLGKIFWLFLTLVP